jgi:hypothetical protein
MIFKNNSILIMIKEEKLNTMKNIKIIRSLLKYNANSNLIKSNNLLFFHVIPTLMKNSLILIFNICFDLL